jgi:alpha-galactosidase
MLAAYLAFWREHRDLLLDGRLAPLEPGLLYPQVQARGGGKWLAACYGDGVVRLPRALPAAAFLVNGTFRRELAVAVPRGLETDRRLRVFDCTGRCRRDERRRLRPGLQAVEVPPAGFARLERG